MWTLQRPNKGPDKTKWRINKESKYSSLLRPKKKGEQSPPIEVGPPPPLAYRTLDSHPDPRMMVDPRMMSPQMMNQQMMNPQMMNPQMMNQHPRNAAMIDPSSMMVGPPRSMDHRPPSDPRAIYARPMEAKGLEHWPPRPLPKSTDSSSSSDSDEEMYPRLRSKSRWIQSRKRDASKDRLGNGDRTPPSSNGLPSKHPFDKDVEPKSRPLQDMNGREKHVERFLASLETDSAPAPGMEVVSRQKILSRSRDDLNYECEDDDAWYDLDQLVKEHIHEILKKWEQIDDGIWAKAVVFEKNRRVAKAYVRPPILTVNGSDTGFDGHRIGLKGFDNPMRDAKTAEIISKNIGPGVKIRMDNKGNIEVKKLSQNNVYAKALGEENAINDEIIKNQWALESGKQMLFDIKKFEQNVNKEVRRAYPNRAKLENQCIMALAFAKSGNILQCPSWVMIINIVAMDMLRSKLPIGLYVKVPSIKNRPRLPVPEEDPYALTGGGSGTSSGGSSGKEKSGKDKPPKLPPRDNQSNSKSSSKADYDSPEESVFRRLRITSKNNSNNNSKEKDRKYDDPYYCGLRAKIPNIGKSRGGGKDRGPEMVRQYPLHPQMTNPAIFHSRSVDSGMAYMQQPQGPYYQKHERNPCSWVPAPPAGYDSDFTESPYSHIYGRLPLSNRAYMSPAHLQPHGLYTRDWD